MAKTIKAFHTADGDLQYDYNALANIPIGLEGKGAASLYNHRVRVGLGLSDSNIPTPFVEFDMLSQYSNLEAVGTHPSLSDKSWYDWLKSNMLNSGNRKIVWGTGHTMLTDPDGWDSPPRVVRGIQLRDNDDGTYTARVLYTQFDSGSGSASTGDKLGYVDYAATGTVILKSVFVIGLTDGIFTTAGGTELFSKI